MATTKNTRERIGKILDDGLLDPKIFAEMCIRWMTNDDLNDMLRAEDLDVGSDMFD